MANLRKGLQFFNSGNYKQAVQEFLDLGKKPEEDSQIAYYLGLCYLRLGEADKARQLLEYVISSDLDFVRVYQSQMLLAYICIMDKDWDLAEIELKRIIERGFDSVQAYSMLGFVLWRKNEIQEAVNSYERALNLNEHNANALNSLGYILIDSDIDIKRGLQLVHKALKKDPANPMYLDSLGWAYFKSKQYSNAKRYLRRAIDSLPYNQDILEHYQQLQQFKEAEDE